ncbi:MAG: DUF2129 domain-containing protein [Candidatus Izemoplasma sp.]
MLKRKSLIVYFRNPKVLKEIGKISDIKYYHKKRRYAILYVNEEEVEEVSKKIKAIKNVRRVEESLNDNEEYQLDFDVK